MAHRPALQTLIELAEQRTDDAQRALGALNSQGADLEGKLALLLQYREDYCARFQASMQNGLSASGWRNYQDFLGKLDAAIAQQREALAYSRRRIEAGRQAWQSARRTLKSYDALSQRQSRAESMRLARREQKETDEFAGKAAARQNLGR